MSEREAVVKLSKAEMWALIGAIDGIWADEQNPEHQTAHDKLWVAYSKLSAGQHLQEQSNDPTR